MPDAQDVARHRFLEAVEGFRRAALRAIETALDPKADGARVADARLQATYALAAAAATFKAALKAARPSDPDA